MIKSGELRHLVTLQRPSGARDAVGGRVTTWDAQGEVHAKIEPIQGRERFYAAQRQASTSHMVTVRYGPETRDIDATWRIKFGTRIFTVDEPPRNTEERNIELVMMCTEGPRDE